MAARSSLTTARVMVPLGGEVLRIDRRDLVSLGVGLLYRMGRLTAGQYAEMLGGVVAYSDGELWV